MAAADKIERQLAALANDWRKYFGKSEAEIAELVEFNRARLIEAAGDSAARRSPFFKLPRANEHSTMTFAQQGIAAHPSRSV